MKHLRVGFLCLLLTFAARSAAGQSPALTAPSGIQKGFYEAKGYYGTSYGTASYGLVRSYSAFASPFGPGMGYGYPPATIMPGQYGMGLWRPGQNLVGDQYIGSSRSYRTFAVPYVAGAPAVPLPPIGAYAPHYGPGLTGW